jgi:hypothetical protein
LYLVSKRENNADPSFEMYFQHDGDPHTERFR